MFEIIGTFLGAIHSVLLQRKIRNDARTINAMTQCKADLKVILKYYVRKVKEREEEVQRQREKEARQREEEARRQRGEEERIQPVRRQYNILPSFLLALLLTAKIKCPSTTLEWILRTFSAVQNISVRLRTTKSDGKDWRSFWTTHDDATCLGQDSTPSKQYQKS